MVNNFGYLSLGIGIFGLINAFIKGYIHQYERAQREEIIAIGWFILAALLLR